jgi:hypothetical protein
MLILYLLGLYLAAGAIFAIWFLIALIEKIDDSAAGAPWTFRLIIFPGCVVFWPLLVKKYLHSVKHDQDG